MSRKNTVIYPLATGQSLSAAFTTPVTVVTHLDNVSYQIVATTTDSAGTFAVQISNDYVINETTNAVRNPGTWTPLTLSGVPTLSGATDNISINLNQLPFLAVRLAYTPTTAGTGTANITLVAKQLGG